MWVGKPAFQQPHGGTQPVRSGWAAPRGQRSSRVFVGEKEKVTPNFLLWHHLTWEQMHPGLTQAMQTRLATVSTLWFRIFSADWGTIETDVLQTDPSVCGHGQGAS